MNKTEFLDILRQQLEGEMPSGEIYGHIRYYDDYIEQQLGTGKSPEQVLEELGDPRLIAKTLIDADEAVLHRNDYTDASYTEYRETAGGTENGETMYEEKPKEPKVRSFHLDLSTWYGKLMLIAAAGLIIFLLVTLIGALMPVIIIVVLVSVLMTIIRKR